ncbi:MAG: class I SAM-dependent methyltransferase [Zoogloeaceae bacterium]|jgi:ubiquinone/menaquinone biosynthesis C-methylase UbiE|nr:class I SAM-dependent methyltransferase [Zoogloeaceae bacterium]
MPKNNSINLEFSRKYDLAHAQQYLHKHQDGLARRLSHWRETQLARRALELADEPDLVLDLPCGAGRFWPMLCEKPGRTVFAADNSADMLAVARAAQAAEVALRIKSFQTSAFAIDLSADSVDCIFCIRLLHHIESAKHRLAILREFHRVSRDTVIVSLWVDGNYKAWKRSRLEKRRAAKMEGAQNQNRFVVSRQVIEQEFSQAGFMMIKYLDFLPCYAMWRTYVLRKECRALRWLDHISNKAA